jgi:cation-transporting ATPase 13A3/4/5
MSNSNTLSSMVTLETNTQSKASKERDLECGDYQKNVYNPYNLAPELASNKYRFAMDGKTWAICKEHFPELMGKFVTRGTIFARMSPDQKQALIGELQDLGYYVAMCGDGANDCGALKSAHTGISLSEAESSVASPFTSRNATIACVPEVIKEGRTALVTSFGIFKYMASYSLVQFTSVLILYSIDSNLTDWQYLYIDLFMISIFAFFFGKTESYDGPLERETPLNSLISLSPVISLLLHVLVTVTLQTGAWFHVQAQPWFQPFVYDSDSAISEFLGCHQNYAIFAVSCFQYISLAVVFSKGKPYRKTIFSNKGFLLSILINVAFSAYMIMIPADFMIHTFGMVSVFLSMQI